MKEPLHVRLKFAIDVRLILARAASPGPWEYATVRGVTSIGQPYVLPSVAADVPHEMDVHYLVAHDPTTMIRLYGRDLKVLERHKPSSSGQWCDFCDGLVYPCDEIGDLATAYGVEFDYV